MWSNTPKHIKDVTDATKVFCLAASAQTDT